MDEQKTTKLGTPLSTKWDEEWVAEVEGVEEQLNHRICGAHSPAFTPCKLASTHSNGRCRYHGGAPGIGAPFGNRNAVIHGLYSRRLQQCGEHCPLWQMCPMPNKDVQALSLKERPYCVYEKEEYELVTSSLGKEPTFSLEKEKVGPKETDSPSASPDIGVSLPEENVGELLLNHNIAMYQTMLTRAQTALSWQQLVEETRADSENYSMRSTKVSTLLQAQLRIARELRQWLRLLANDAMRLALGMPKTDPVPESLRPMGLADYMKPIIEKAKGVLENAIDDQYRIDAGLSDPDDPDIGDACPAPG